MTATATANGQVAGPFGNTTLTKVFVGGLAWETPADKLREYFEKFGDILEAVIISDKLSGRSKGYGFVTFKEPEAAKNACEDPAPIINGRRANCNLAAQGSRRRKTPPTPPTAPVNQPGMISFYNVAGKPRLAPIAPAPSAGNFQWCFPAGILPAASPFYHQHPQAASPFYGCSPAYISADYNQVSWNGGTYYPQQQMYRGATLHVMRGPAANTWMMPMYPQLYCHPHHQPQTLGHPAHMFPSVAAGPFTVYGPTSDPLSHQPTMF